MTFLLIFGSSKRNYDPVHDEDREDREDCEDHEYREDHEDREDHKDREDHEDGRDGEDGGNVELEHYCEPPAAPPLGRFTRSGSSFYRRRH